MCDVRQGRIRRTEVLTLTSAPTRFPARAKFGPVERPDLERYLILQCRHPGTGWEDLPFPGDGEYLEIPAGSEMRMVAKSREDLALLDDARFEPFVDAHGRCCVPYPPREEAPPHRIVALEDARA